MDTMTTDTYWRAIILFGSDSATYEIAFGKALLEAVYGDRTFVSGCLANFAGFEP